MKIKLVHQSDIPEGKSILVISPRGKQIAIFNVQGLIFALDNTCPHMGGPLSQGDIEGCVVTCPWHGWQFDVTSGDCQNMPGENAEKIPIEIIEGFVYIDEE
jgi:nitrite reductase (NADH) small subunit